MQNITLKKINLSNSKIGNIYKENDKNDFEYSDESDEKLNQILSKFKNSNENQDLGNTEQFLIDVLNQDSNTCLICIESIENKQPIWNCDGCFAQFHIVCIQNWIRDGSYLAISNNHGASEEKPREIPWHCPKCRKDYKQQNYPSTYYCYCKKVKDPKFDPWSLPHSCNQICNKLKPCSHPCLTICHPGPCPPCPKMVTNSCYCAKSTAVSRRCSNKYWSCNKTCNKLLECKQHLCERICHANSCGECLKTSIQFCKCKKNRKNVLCTQTKWECEEKCSKPYLCGFHSCEKICHDGNCGECPRSLKRTCPCGKTKSQKPCTENIPPCGDTCDKSLNCNFHKCVERCHAGSCGSCQQSRTRRCRCGQFEKTLPCSQEFTCEIKCNRLRDCGKHKCNKKCCDGNCPPCEKICDKTLSCKNHKCKSVCHSGPCYPCPIIDEIFCPCGFSKLKVPCSKNKANIRVSCKQLCNLKSKCHHPMIQQHKCHYDQCPPCKLKCNLTMKCNHICQAICHSAVITQTIENKHREGPWVPLKVKEQYENLKCPDCVQPVKVTCLGRHETSDLPCHRAAPYNCGRKCGRLLECTHHTCQLECHIISDENIQSINQNNSSKYCLQCESPCEQPRPLGCEHECSIGYCHMEACPKCTKLIKMKCHCNSNFVYVECYKWNTNQKEKDELKSCKVPCTRQLKCGHQCVFICHANKCSNESDCQTKLALKCACKTLRKSVLCNQLKQIESELKEVMVSVNTTGGMMKEKKFLLKCNDKCALKQVKADDDDDKNEKSDTVFDAKRKRHNTQANNYTLFILALIILIASIAFYFIYVSITQ